MTTKKTSGAKSQELTEFNSADGQSSVPEPYLGGSSARGADRSGGEKAIPDFATRAEVVQQIMGHITSMNKDQLGNLFKGLSSPTDPGRAADQKAGEKGQIFTSPTSVHPDWEGNVHPTKDTVTDPGPEQHTLRISPTAVVSKEDIDDIFGGEELSEDIKEKTKVVFEATVNARLIQEVARLQEENEAYLEEAVEEIRVELTEKVDEYLSYVAEEWVKENEVELEAGITNEMATNLLLTLKNFFEENYVTVSEDAVDVVEELSNKIEELEADLNAATTEILNLRQENDELAVAEAFNEATIGLTEMQINKLATLSEGIVYDNVDEFNDKLNVLKETYFASKPAKGVEILSEDHQVEGNDEPTVSGPMKQYLEAAVRHSKSQI